MALYSESGRSRELDFEPGALNIITGASKTGKSSILDIIDYCMGSSAFPVAVGVVRRHVRAYALLLQREQEDGLLVVRFAPQPGRSVSTQFHIRTMSPDGSLPALEELAVTADVETAKGQLSEFVGIDENLFEPETGSRRPLRATIRHCLFFCLQSQDEVASRSVLFHGQSDEYVPQAIRDVLPYFLGAVPEDHLAKMSRLRQLRRELRTLERGAAERRALQGPSGRAEALAREAAQVGLIDADAPDSGRSILELLSDAMGAPEPMIDLPGPSIFGELNAQRRELRSEYSRVQSSLANLRVLEVERRQFADRAGEQRSRLSLSAMFGPTDDGTTCPVCSTGLDTELPGAQEMATALAALQSEIATVATTTPELDSLISAAVDRLAELEASLNDNRVAMEEVERGRDLIAQAQDAAVQRATVRGRISLFLGSQPDAVADMSIESRLEEIRVEVRSLESELDSDEVAARLESAQSRVNAGITSIADRLELEHAGLPVRLDIRNLTVVADGLDGPVSLDQMGSGDNWLGYHLAAMLGLHRFFIEAARPVPRFLALDQPSQVYFPPDVDAPDMENDEDRAALERMLAAVRSEIDRHSGQLQVIVVDHADLDVDWFQQAVLEKWRGGLALVPAAWLDDD